MVRLARKQEGWMGCDSDSSLALSLLSDAIQLFTVSTEEVVMSVKGDSFENRMGTGGAPSDVDRLVEQDEDEDEGCANLCSWHDTPKNFENHSSASTDSR